MIRLKLKEQNILFLTRTMNLGGTENVILQLCEILKPLVNKIIVCSCGGVNVKNLDKMGIKHYEIPDFAEKRLSKILLSYSKIKSVVKNEKITVIHSHHRMAALYAELVTSNDIIKIANVHNTFYNKRKLTCFAYKNTKLIAVGENVKRNLVDFFRIPEQQIVVIHNAVKAFSGVIQPIELLEKEKQAGNVLIGNVGRLSEQKGMRYFIDAAEIIVAYHPKSRFIIVGDGEERCYLQELVKHKGLSEHVFFLGYRADIQNIMSQLDFIVLSSLWEGLPLTPIEAYSVGKTVVGTSVDGTPEIIQDNIDGFLVEAKDSNALAEKIKYLIENPEIKAKFEKNAKERYDREFSYKKLADRYINYYEKM